MSAFRVKSVVLIALAFALPVAAQEKEKQVNGTLQEIDAQVGTLTVTSMPKQQVKKFNLARKDLPVTDPLGNPLKLADLRKHHRLALTVVGDEDVTAIRLETDLDWGVVKSIDAKNRQLVLHIGYVARPVNVAVDAPIIVDGQPGTFKAVKAAGAVKMLLTPDRTMIRHLWAGKGVVSANPYCQRIHVTGFVTSVDQNKKKLTMLTTDRYKPAEFDFDNWTYARLTHSSYVLGDMPVDKLRSPFKVSLYYESDTMRASNLSIDAPFINRRHVEKFDLERRKLTLAPDANDPQEEFTVAADAQVLFNGRPVPLARVREKGLVSVGLSLDQREVIFIMYLDR